MNSETELFFEGGNCEVTKELFRKALIDRVDYDRAKVINYLEQGKEIACCGRECRDVFTDEHIDLSFAVQTDGEYYWRSDLPYYINKYNLKLPEKLLKKIELPNE